MTTEINMQDITIVRRFLPTGGAIAVLDSDIKAQVFIAARVATTLSLQEGDQATAILVPNTVRPDATKWYAHRVMPRVGAGHSGPVTYAAAAEPEPVDPHSVRGNRILSFIEGGDPWTAAELADEMGIDASVLRGDLEDLVEAGSLAKAVLYAKGGAMARTWYMTDHTNVDLFAVDEEGE